ncbi:MAG: type II and III secretion system protein family protein [Rhodospirillales bacterium]|nr:type II and III secretion system protein family protein [Rhodospirillales bacterium]
MIRRARAILLTTAVGIAIPALAQTPPLLPPENPPAAAPAAPPLGAAATPPAAAPTAEMAPQPVRLPAGTGMLLRLPRPAATIMSAEPAVARVQPASPTSLFLMGVSPGRTTVIATTDAGVPIVEYDVTVTPGANGIRPGMVPLGGGPPAAPAGPVQVSATTAAAIRAAIIQSVPGAANVEVQPAGAAVVLGGIVPTATAGLQAEAIAHAYLADKGAVIDKLEVLGSIQVNVRVRIAEISRQITRQLGFNWQALGTIGSIGTLPALNLNLPGTVGGGAAALASGACAGLALSVQCLGGSINGIIDALASDNLITVLAEPNLTAQSGETASFLAGGEFPIPIAGSSFNGQVMVTVEFKQFGVSLAVVPTVLAPNRLNLRIRPEVSQLSSAGAVSVPIGTGTLTIPALTVQRAETTVELGSGQSFAIAGLLQRTTNDTLNALPGIGELPVLGALFRSSQFQRGDTELVIVVTPYIVRPVAGPGLLRTPVDHFVPATDLDRILFGHQMANAGPQAPDVTLPPGAGFILK